MRAVDDRERIRVARAAAERRDVVHPPLVHSMCEQKTTRVRGPGRARRTGRRRASRRSGGDEVPEELHAAVLRVAEQHLVARAEVERADDRVQRRARVRREGEVVRARPDVGREAAAGRVEQLRKAPLEGEKLDRLALQLALKALVGLEHGRRAGAERAVVQEHHAGIEEELLLHHS